jgi:N-methylhydantoinase A/oxoprolinase/acetone carboxylase beta subunit
VSRFRRGSGLPVRIPALDLIEIGAGGGSIARVDGLGTLAVGPESAGADPGPACYGRGGDAPTVTDADLVLGYLGASAFLGGAMPLDPARAEAVIARAVAEPLALTPVEAAAGIVRVVTANMATALTVYAAEKGLDLRRFTLFAFGGAGPVHAAGLAARAGIREIVIPPSAGVLSALGCAIAPLSFDLATSYKVAIDRLDVPRANALLAAMEGAGVSSMKAATRERPVVTRSVDLRYLGQRYEVNVPLAGRPLRPSDVAQIQTRFQALYRRRYGRDIRGVAVEAVTFRINVASPPLHRGLPRWPAPAGVASLRGRRPVCFAGRWLRTCPVYDRHGLRPGTRIAGPAVVEERESTTVVPPGARIYVDADRHLVMTLGRGARS